MKSFRILSCLLILTALTGCARFQPTSLPATALPSPTEVQNTPASTGALEDTLNMDGTLRHYRFYVPTSYRVGQPLPLVLNFHGYGATSLDEERLSGMSPKAESAGFIVVYPDGLDREWNDGTGARDQADLQFITRLVQVMQARYSIDPRRIYATGMSNGGGMANRVGCSLSNIIAAIAPVAGAYNLWKECPTTRPLPVLAFHGTADKVVPFEGAGLGNMDPPIVEWAAFWADRNGCHTTPSITRMDPTVNVTTWDGCQQNASVILYAIDNHGHSWPGSSLLIDITSQVVNATDVMWDFFQTHPMP